MNSRNNKRILKYIEEAMSEEIGSGGVCVWFAVLSMVGQGRLVESCQLSRSLRGMRSGVTFRSTQGSRALHRKRLETTQGKCTKAGVWLVSWGWAQPVGPEKEQVKWDVNETNLLGPRVSVLSEWDVMAGT